ncbi:MAG TPA: 8-oxo-dGTP diphosphatase [Trueperaceae bacterium]
MLTTLAYLRHGGRTLMMLRNRKPNDVHEGKWNGLGGRFEGGESPEECMRREVREESGLEVEEAQLKGILTFPNFAGRGDRWVFVFVVTRFSGKQGECAEGELHWIDDAELLDLELWPGDRVFLPWLNEPGLFSAKFTYEGGRLVSHQVEFY